MTFDEWLKFGFDNGWCSPSVCGTHDGVPMTADESEDEEPCVHIVRLYDSPATKKAVEEAHSPSVWRASNKGWTTEGDTNANN